MGKATSHDPLGYKIVTGKMDFADDHLAGQKWWAALKGSPNANGSIATDPGTITGVNVTAGGSGYTSAPSVVFAGGGGSGAAGTATVAGGAVTAVTLTSAGSGYTSVPTVAFTGGGGTGATATAVFKAGKAHIDASAALAFPGVKGVFWYESFPEAPALPATETRGGTFQSSWWCYGAPIAAVVADDWETARYACSLIKIEYTAPKTNIFDADAAMAPGAPLSGRVATSNVTTSTHLRPAGGNVQDGFTQPGVQTIQVDTPWTPTFQHNPVHCKTALAYWIGDDVYDFVSSQNGTAGRAPLAQWNGVGLHKAHSQIHGCGGGHGDGYTETLGAMAALMSRKLGGHAISYKISRQGHNHIGSRQYDGKSSHKVGYKADGTLVAWQGSWYGNGGGAGGFWNGLRMTYVIPYVDWKATNIYTNTPARGAWRCVSDPPGTLMYDRAIDEIAAKLGMDPYQLRMKNMMPVSMADQDSPNRYWCTKGVNPCMEKVHAESGYAAKWHAPGTKTLADGRKHGIHICGHQDGHGSVNGTTRHGHLRMGGQDNSGKCFAYVGGSRGSACAQGAMMSIAAEVLGLKYEDMALGEWANSDINLDTGSQGGSAYTGGAGSGFYRAAVAMRNKLFERAITLAPFKTIAGINVGMLEAKDSEIFLKTDPNVKTTHAAVTNGMTPYIAAEKGWNTSGTLPGDGLQREFAIDGKVLPAGTLVNNNAGTALCIEIAVDEDTGEVEVLGIWNACHTGTTAFRPGVLKTIGEGNELVVGQTLFYGDVYDPATGAILSMSHGSFQHPTSLDLKSDVLMPNLYDIEDDPAANPCGARGIAEPALVHISALTGAIFNATGKWLDWQHCAGGPNQVLRALGKA
jgi:CO/xanthine dehydrogenase Mo-binding subunit